MPDTTHHLPPADGSGRLDQWLVARLPHLSRSRVQALVRDGRVTLADGTPLTRPNHTVKQGDVLIVVEPAATPMTVAAEKIPLEILYEDEHLLVLNKPEGLSVHPAPGAPNGTLVNALLHHCKNLSGIGGVERPGIVHRLDKGTSGVMVVAKNDHAHQHLSAQFADRTITRFYHALCYGVPTMRAGVIEGNIARHPTHRQKMAVVQTGGRTARTSYKVLDTFADEVSLVELKLFTGRTHQIRVHMTHIGHSLLGDPVYGRPKALKHAPDSAKEILKHLKHQALHAFTLGFDHPKTGERLEFSTPLPHDLADLLRALRG
jgi:23S rRNA pseudouridine1911/1915/1917 synthase